MVIPPFTPLVVDPRQATVSCVLRQHDLNGVGLWSQVSSQGRPLLNAPMRLEVESGGKTYVAAGPSTAFSETSADRVRGQAGPWVAGPVRGNANFEFDYDGLEKVTLQTSADRTRIDAMRLVIPMKTSEAWLMHPVTDLLRHHYAGRIQTAKVRSGITTVSGTMSNTPIPASRTRMGKFGTRVR